MFFVFAATSAVPDRSLAFTLTVIIAGLGTVLATLALLILIFNIFGKVFSSLNNKKKKPAQPEKNPVVTRKNEVPPPLPVEPQNGTPPEVVAAITAAIYTLEGEGAVIKSIKRKSSPSTARSEWAQAAVTENTKPF